MHKKLNSTIFMITVLTASLLAGNVSQAQDYSKNIFDRHNDVGVCMLKGDPHFMPGNQEYIITGSGVILSFLPEGNADAYPFYKHVYIKIMPAEGGTPKVVAYHYGGQGSINVPSWSPYGKQIAFVSNTGPTE